MGEPSQYFFRKPINKDGEDVLYNGEHSEMALGVVQQLMAHFGEKLTELFLLTDLSLCCLSWPFFILNDSSIHSQQVD